MAGIGRKIFYGLLTLLIGVVFVVPLFMFAIITFTASVWFLLLLVFFKGIGAIWRSLVQWWHGDARYSPEAIAHRERTAAHAKRIARSHHAHSGSSSSNTTTRSHSNRSNRSNSNVSLASLPQPDRDYEGVGGWYIPQDNDNNTYPLPLTSNNDGTAERDSQTPSLNLSNRRTGAAVAGVDGTPTAFRRRSFGASSSGINSPEVISMPSNARYASVTTPHGRSAPAPGSPQSYFNSSAAGRSSTSVNSRSSRVASGRPGNGHSGSEDEHALL